MNSLVIDRHLSPVRSLRLGLGDILYSPNRSFLFLLDLFVSAVGFLCFSWMSPYVSWGEVSSVTVVSTIFFSLGFVFFALGMGYYERQRRYSLQKILVIAAISSLFSMTLCLAAAYFYFYEMIGRQTFIWGAMGAFISASLLRLILIRITQMIPYTYTMVGYSERILSLVQTKNIDGPLKGLRTYFIPLQDLLDADGQLSFDKLRKNHVSDVVFAKSAFESGEGFRLAVEALRCKLRLYDETEFFAIEQEQLPVDDVRKHWILTHSSLTRNYKNQVLKRLLDIFLSLIGLVLLSPVFLIIIVAIKFDSPGPVFFNQPRQGRYNRPFLMFKFRTMYAEKSCLQASQGFTRERDKRITRVGRLLRPLHLDELPQLLNIFWGQMSLVGPRPEALEFARRMSQQIPIYDLRYLLQPGLSGHAQIMGGYALDTVEDTKRKLSYDLHYLVYGTILVDIRIIVRTFFVVLRKLVRAAT